MALDKLSIGMRLREIRENIYHETRHNFAERCNLSENHLGKLERGELLISIKALDKIYSATATDPNYILYGKCTNKNLKIRQTLDNFLDSSSKDELKMYLKFISTIKGFIIKEK